MLKRLTGNKKRSHEELKDRIARTRYCADICQYNCYFLQADRYQLDVQEKYIDPLEP